MRLEKASYKAIKYACLNFHYAKKIPVNVTGYSVFNDAKEWCGVIIFGSGATNNIAEPYGLKSGQVVELVRIALNGKQESTGKALSVALKMIKKDMPLVQVVVSYADSEQGHTGIIYQATNWIYTNASTDTNLIVNGLRYHRRSLGSKYGTSSIEALKAKGLDVKQIKTKPKWKYIYPLDKSLIPMCKELAKPYPKTSDSSITANAAGFQLAEEGQHHPIAQNTLPL